MKLPHCAADDCREPFEPVQEYQKYCSPRCASRMRVRLCRARKRYGGDDGGGPGSKRQPRLFPVSAMHRRKPVKSALKPKQDQLFPDDGATLHATFGGAVEYATDGSASDKNKYSVKYGQRIQPTSVKPEADLAA